VVAAFDGGAVTSYAGGLLLGATDRAIKLVDRFAGCFTDHRRADLVEHEVRTLVSQRVFGISLGYEDLNDHDQLPSRSGHGHVGRKAQRSSPGLRAAGGQKHAQPA
jgi:hypothetical protein